LATKECYADEHMERVLRRESTRQVALNGTIAFAWMPSPGARCPSPPEAIARGPWLL
jgi:hypothetical protein